MVQSNVLIVNVLILCLYNTCVLYLGLSRQKGSMETLEIVRKRKRAGMTLISLLMSHIMQGQQCFRGDEDAYLRVSHPRTMSKCADCNLANSQGKKLTVASGKFPT